MRRVILPIREAGGDKWGVVDSRSICEVGNVWCGAWCPASPALGPRCAPQPEAQRLARNMARFPR
eukprot:scaffold13220_cov113-Isochrysis_galbana.AAC.6